MGSEAVEVRWLTVGRAAKRLGVSPTAVRRLVESGRITSRSVPCARLRVPLDEVERIVKESTRPATAAARV